MHIHDPWAELGVTRGASRDDIKAAWRRQVKEWHPDRNKSREALTKIQRINRAYEILCAEPQHDTQEHFTQAGRDWWERWANPGNPRANDDEDAGWQRGPGEKAPKPVQRTAHISLEEAMTGCRRSFRGKTVDLCSSCAGARVFRSSVLYCTSCEGEGKLFDFSTGRRRTCKDCSGTGDAHMDCSACGGSGQAADAREWEVSVNIPPGARPGQVVVAKGYGQRGADGARADLEITIEMKPHDLFEVDDHGRLCASVPVDVFSFMTRISVRVPLLGGGEVAFDLAKGATQEIEGLGLAGRDGARGPLVLRAVPVVPRELSEREHLYLQALAGGQKDEGYQRCEGVASWWAKANAYRAEPQSQHATGAKATSKR